MGATKKLNNYSRNTTKEHTAASATVGVWGFKLASIRDFGKNHICKFTIHASMLHGTLWNYKPQRYKTFFMLNSTEDEILTAYKN